MNQCKKDDWLSEMINKIQINLHHIVLIQNSRENVNKKKEMEKLQNEYQIKNKKK